MRVRLVDVAERAGVSEATVSRVANGKPVSDRTRALVLDAMQELGFGLVERRPESARGLVGVIVPELSNPVFAQYGQVLEGELVRHGLTPVLCTQVVGGVPEGDYVDMLVEQGAVAFVFVSGLHAVVGSDPEPYAALRRRGLPLVLVNGRHPGIDAPTFSLDDRAAVEIAVEHLAQLGHSRIGFASGSLRYTPAARRAEAFAAAVAARFPGEEPLVETIHFSAEGGATAAQQLVRRGATGIVCGSDIMALGAIGGLRRMGLRVPDDVSVVGSDDSELMRYTDPPLTTVRHDAATIAAAAVQALVDELDGRPSSRDEVLFAPDLVVRASTRVRPERVSLVG